MLSAMNVWPSLGWFFLSAWLAFIAYLPWNLPRPEPYMNDAPLWIGAFLCAARGVYVLLKKRPNA